jgi:hypothetical protein
MLFMICPTRQINDHFLSMRRLWYGPEASKTIDVKRNFLKRFNVIWGVQPLPQKYSDFQKSQISLYPSPSRLTRGALRGRHGRWVRDAVDADGAADESA